MAYDITTIDDIDPRDFLDPQLLVDEYHPDNQEFMQEVNRIRRMVVHQRAQCRQPHVAVARRYVKGERPKKIAEEIGYTPTTIHAILRRPEVLRLIATLQHLNALFEGPSIAHRKRLLFEIATDAKKNDRKSAIAAIREMNNMDGVGKTPPEKVIEININNDQFKQSPLDIVPKTFDTKDQAEDQ